VDKPTFILAGDHKIFRDFVTLNGARRGQYNIIHLRSADQLEGLRGCRYILISQYQETTDFDKIMDAMDERGFKLLFKMD
jgi:hypothetical protein